MCPFKSAKKRKKYNKEYYRKYHERNKEKYNKQAREYYRTHKEDYREREHNYRMKLRKRVNKELGDTCIICGTKSKSKKSLACHEVHGKPHKFDYNYILRHKEDFVRMCPICHRTLHFFLKYKTKFEEIIKRGES